MCFRDQFGWRSQKPIATDPHKSAALCIIETCPPIEITATFPVEVSESWSIFEQVQAKLKERGWITYPGLYNRLTATYAGGRASSFEFCVVDEAQDVSVAQLHFLSALSGGRPNSLRLFSI